MENSGDKKMEFITFIKVKVPDSKLVELKEGFKSLKEYGWPEQQIIYLLQDPNVNGSYILMTVMEEEKAQEKIRSVTQTPIFDLLQKLGLEQTSKEVYNVINKIPCPTTKHVPYFSIK